MPRTEKHSLHWIEFLLGLSWVMVWSHWQVRFSMPHSAAGGWEIWFRKTFACADINAQVPQKDVGYLGYHCCLCLFFSKNFPSASLCPGAFTALAVWTGSTCYLYCFSCIRPFNHQQFLLSEEYINPKKHVQTMRESTGSCIVFLLVSGPSCSFGDSDANRLQGGEIKKLLWNISSLSSSFSPCNLFLFQCHGNFHAGGSRWRNRCCSYFLPVIIPLPAMLPVIVPLYSCLSYKAEQWIMDAKTKWRFRFISMHIVINSFQ